MLRSLCLLAIILIGAAGCRDSPTSPAPPSRNYQIGQYYEFNVSSTSACDEADHRTGRVVAITDRAIVIADTTNPSGTGTFTDAEYTSFGLAFDEHVWPNNVQSFGAPHDVDGNGRIILFFTRAVNELTPRGQSWYIGGFFFSRDLFPREENRDFRACPTSNEGEILYMLVPDPQGQVNGNPRTKTNELSGTVTVLAHEFQHLINASRRLFVVKAGGTGWQEETWLNEGLSHIAEELLGYSTSTLAPRQNIDAARLTSSSTERSAFLRHQYPNANRYSDYLEAPEANSLMGPDSLSTRGAVWSFLRYAADRKGGDEAGLWRSLVTSSTSGITNLRAVLGVEPMDWIHDWVVSIAADDHAAGLSAPYRQPSWNFRSIFPWVRDAAGRPLHGGYPLKTYPLTSGQQRQVGISGASAAFLTFGVGAGATAELRMGGSTAACTAGTTVGLVVGQTHSISSDGTGTLCVSGGSTGGEFMLIPFSTSTGPGQVSFVVRPSAVIGTTSIGGISERLRQDPGDELRRGREMGDPHARHRWESELRERESEELGPLVRSAGQAAPSQSISAVSGASSTLLQITLVRLK